MDRFKQIQELDLVIQSKYNTGAVYIANQAAAEDISLLNKFQINAIITVAKNSLLYHPYLNSSNYLYIPAEDNNSYQIIGYFDKACHFINNQRQKTNVLIHCYNGISMSATIILAYLMKQSNMKFIEAYLQLRRKKSKVQPNSGFIFQLYQYENTINKYKEMQDIRDCISTGNHTYRSILTQKPGQNKSNKQNKQNKNQQFRSMKKNKSILSSGKSLIKKKVSFKIMDDEIDTIIPSCKQKTSQIKSLKKYSTIKDELKDLKENIDMLRLKLNERKEIEVNLRQNLNKFDYKKRTFY